MIPADGVIGSEPVEKVEVILALVRAFESGEQHRRVGFRTLPNSHASPATT